MEPFLEEQPPTHVIKSLGHVLVKLMGFGLQQSQTVKKLVRSRTEVFQKLFDLCCLSTELCDLLGDHTSAFVVGVIAVVWFVISMVIIALLCGYIVHMKKILKQKQ